MIINNHLFLKIPDGKPPFIGVAYEANNNFGSQTNTDLLKYKNKEVSLVIRRSPLTLEIIVMIKGFYHTYGYCNVSYSPGEFDAWLRACKDSKNINFGHVQKFEFGHVLCHTNGNPQPFFIPLDKIMVVEERSGSVIAIK